MKISNLLNLLFLTIILSSCMTTTDYVGDYKNGKYHGNGSISFSSGEMYEGPILYSGTNLLYEGPLTGKIVSLEEGEDISHLRKVRKNSRFAYANEW